MGESDDETKVLVHLGMTARQEMKIRKAIRRAQDLYGVDEGTALERFADFWIEQVARRVR